MWSDLRQGFRALRKNPSFTAVAVATLALGIGANTALFSVINGVLLNPLPFPHPDQLVTLHESKPNFNRGSISLPNFQDWQKSNHTFSSMALYRNYTFTLSGAGEPRNIAGEFLSSDFFSQLGVTPLLGRAFLPGEDQIGAAPAALISEDLWRNTFRADPSILTRTITLNGRGYSVIGVIPASFRLQVGGFRDRDLYVPIGQWNNPLLTHRDAGLGIHGIGRLRPGVTFETARADMDTLSSQLSREYPAANRGVTAAIVPLRESMLGSVQPLLLLLFGAVGFVLLIACVNVANLQLARSTARAREFAIRTALGAGRARVVRQLTVEGLLLSLAGGGLGVLLASYGTQAVLRALPVSLPRAEAVGFDGRVLAFTVIVSLLAGVLAAVSPLLFRSSGFDFRAAAQQGARGVLGARSRTQGVFVVVEMALALVLLIGCGLMLRSMASLWRVDPGFDPHHLLTFGVALPERQDDGAASANAVRGEMRELESRLATLPGVDAVAETWEAFPLRSDDEKLFYIEGQARPASDSEMNWTIDYVVSPSYLQTMRIPLVRGRFLTSADNERAPRVAVIDDVFAAKFFPGRDPIGQRLHFSDDTMAQVVGIVRHVRQWGLDSDDSNSLRAQLYLHTMQMPEQYVARNAGAGVVVRSRADGPELWAAIRKAVRGLSADNVLTEAETMDQIIAGALAERQFTLILLGVFAGLALVLAGIGIYGVVSYVVGRRTAEIGVRMALGASRAGVVGLVLRGAGKLAAAGILIGAVAAYFVTGLLDRWLYGVHATDPLTFVVVSLFLLAIALLACYIPARRASSIDPLTALRSE